MSLPNIHNARMGRTGAASLQGQTQLQKNEHARTAAKDAKYRQIQDVARALKIGQLTRSKTILVDAILQHVDGPRVLLALLHAKVAEEAVAEEVAGAVDEAVAGTAPADWVESKVDDESIAVESNADFAVVADLAHAADNSDAARNAETKAQDIMQDKMQDEMQVKMQDKVEATNDVEPQETHTAEPQATTPAASTHLQFDVFGKTKTMAHQHQSRSPNGSPSDSPNSSSDGSPDGTAPVLDKHATAERTFAGTRDKHTNDKEDGKEDDKWSNNDPTGVAEPSNPMDDNKADDLMNDDIEVDNGNTKSNTEGNILGAVNGAVNGAVYQAVHDDGVRDAVSDGVRDAVSDVVRDAVSDVVRDAVSDVGCDEVHDGTKSRCVDQPAADDVPVSTISITASQYASENGDCALSTRTAESSKVQTNNNVRSAETETLKETYANNNTTCTITSRTNHHDDTSNDGNIADKRIDEKGVVIAKPQFSSPKHNDMNAKTDDIDIETTDKNIKTVETVDTATQADKTQDAATQDATSGSLASKVNVSATLEEDTAIEPVRAMQQCTFRCTALPVKQSFNTAMRVGALPPSSTELTCDRFGRPYIIVTDAFLRSVVHKRRTFDLVMPAAVHE